MQHMAFHPCLGKQLGPQHTNTFLAVCLDLWTSTVWGAVGFALDSQQVNKNSEGSTAATKPHESQGSTILIPGFDYDSHGVHIVHLLNHICGFPLLGLKGIDHYWKYLETRKLGV